MDEEVGTHRPDLGGSTISFSNTLTVSSGDAWHFFDSTIKFASGKKLKVYGTLNADDVTFTASGSSWGGVYFASGSGGTIDDSRIEQVDLGAGVGAVKIVSDPYITDTYIENTSTSYGFGVYVSGYYANPRIYNTDWGPQSEIHSASGPAVYVNGDAYLSVHDTHIVQTGSYPAVQAEYDGIVGFWVAAGIYTGENKIKGNELYAQENGMIQGGDSDGRDQNHFCDAAASTLVAESGGVIDAEYNYWYNGQNPSITETGGGVVNFSNNLGASDCSDVSTRVATTGAFELHDAPVLVRSSASPAEASLGKIGAMQGTAVGDDLRALLLEARRKAHQGRYDEAVGLLKQVIGSDQASLAHQALLELGTVLRQIPEHSVVDYVEGLTQQEGPHQATALRVLASAYARQGKESAALDLLEALEQLGSADAFVAQVKRFHLHFAAGRYVEAKRVLQDMEPAGKDDELTLWAARALLSEETDDLPTFQFRYLGESNTELDAQASEEVRQQVGRPSERRVELTAFPNPFNPQTVIRYQLPLKSQVVLRVYDVLGREVRTLVHGTQEPGAHEVSFDAEDLPSGTYVYRLEAAGQVRTGTMLLLK